MIEEFERSRPFGNFYQGRRVLVTGGMGFLGAHVVRRLLSLGADVTVFDIDCSPERASLLNDRRERLRTRAELVEGDVGNIDDVADLMANNSFEVVFHFAAYAVIERSTLHPIDTIRANSFGIVNILEAMRVNNRKPLAVVLSSTDKVYGEMSDEEYREDSPLRGIGLYDAAKLSGDVFARTYHEVYGMPTVVVRLCNLYGPHDYNTDFRLIPRALTSIFRTTEPDAPVLYFDSLSHTRDYLFIDDAVRAFLAVASEPACRGDVFNISASAHASTPEILKTVVELAAAHEAMFDPDRAKKIMANGISVTVRPNSPGVVAIGRQHLDGSKLRDRVGFEPSVRFVDGLQDTIEFYRSYYLRRAAVSP